MSKILRLFSYQRFNKDILRNVSPIRYLCTHNKITEDSLSILLKNRFKDAKEVKVVDVSGGCGAMFEIFVHSNEFKGLSIVKQHKTITDTLKEQIKQIHGLRIETKAT